MLDIYYFILSYSCNNALWFDIRSPSCAMSLDNTSSAVGQTATSDRQRSFPEALAVATVNIRSLS